METERAGTNTVLSILAVCVLLGALSLAIAGNLEPGSAPAPTMHTLDEIYSGGIPTGRRDHKPLTITKECGKATPLIYKMLVDNENITHLDLKFYRTGAGGVEQHYFTIRLENARVCGISSPKSGEEM